MSMIADLRRFLMQCPFLQVPEETAVPKVYVDYLTQTPTVYDISVIPATPWIRKYVDGGGVKQFTFVFRSVEVFGGRDIQQNIGNIDFYERFSEWLTKVKPDIAGWIKVEALTEGYFFDAAESQDKASYQIQCRILYTV